MNEAISVPTSSTTAKSALDLGQEVEPLHGILVPGGFGVRGTEGKIQAVKYAREKKVPFFGICLGLQMAVIEYARSVLGLAGANSVEFDEKTPHPVVSLMESQVNVKEKGGTMRLGSYVCALKKAPWRTACTAKTRSTSATATASR